MLDTRYPGYAQTDLAMNEDRIVAGYTDALKDIVRQSALFSEAAIAGLVIDVRKFEKPLDWDEIAVRDLRTYTPDNHIYEIAIRVEASVAEAFAGKTGGNPSQPGWLQSLSCDAQQIYLARQLIVASFAHVEKLAEQFRMAVNPKYPLTSTPSVEMGAPFKVSIATRRTLDEFFMVGIEVFKQRLNAVCSAVAPASAVSAARPQSFGS